MAIGFSGGASPDLDEGLVLGEEGKVGVIIHRESGETIEGETVTASEWIEIFGEEVHMSKAQK